MKIYKVYTLPPSHELEHLMRQHRTKFLCVLIPLFIGHQVVRSHRTDIVYN